MGIASLRLPEATSGNSGSPPVRLPEAGKNCVNKPLPIPPTPGMNCGRGPITQLRRVDIINSKVAWPPLLIVESIWSSGNTRSPAVAESGTSSTPAVEPCGCAMPGLVTRRLQSEPAATLTGGCDWPLSS